MVPEIQSEADKTFCHFGPFFALLPPLMIPKIKILKEKKNEKNTLRYPFIDTFVSEMKII